MSTLSELVQGVLNVDPSADAIEFEHSWWTWGDLSKIGAAVNAALDGAGLGAQTRWAASCETARSWRRPCSRS
jgi:long-chain acyl-CoA synthetase